MVLYSAIRDSSGNHAALEHFVGDRSCHAIEELRPHLRIVAQHLYRALLHLSCSCELMHMIKKRQLVVEEGDEGLTAAEQFYPLAA
jgi:hypothetical protein